MRTVRLLLFIAVLAGSLHAFADVRAGSVDEKVVVNLNDATAAELDVLPGVGAKAAAAIIAYRQQKPFNRIEELVKVKGFGRKRFLKLKPYLTVKGPTKLSK
jgi:competence protein ComEA